VGKRFSIRWTIETLQFGEATTRAHVRGETPKTLTRCQRFQRYYSGHVRGETDIKVTWRYLVFLTSDQTCHKHEDPILHAMPTPLDEMGRTTAIAENAVALQVPFFRSALLVD
jgi:hypothetical protein